jgi:hypothetical protein
MHASSVHNHAGNLAAAAAAVVFACVADKFTRFSGEVFGALIAILFFQVGIKVGPASNSSSSSGSSTTKAALQ